MFHNVNCVPQKNQRRKLARKESALKAKKEFRAEERQQRAEKRRSGYLSRRVPTLEDSIKAGAPRVCVDFQFGSEMTEKVCWFFETLPASTSSA